MSEDRRKVYSKKGTGTVPKIKYARNTIHNREHEHNLSVSNNLVREAIPSDRTRRVSNSYPLSAQLYAMEQSLDEANHNSVGGSSGQSLHSNDVNSRRNSATDAAPKCDNVSRYPDKRQIEDKLNQIREYLHVTSSLMLNMKNSDEQSTDREELRRTYDDLKDSEAKLTVLLGDVDDYDKTVVEEGNNVEALENGVENVSDACLKLPKTVLEKKVEQANHQIEMLKEQQSLLLGLKQKAESQLEDARRAQQKLLAQNQNANALNYYQQEEGAPTDPSLSDRLQAQVDALQQRVGQLRDTNDNRNQMIQLLDKRDTQLQSEHAELQTKLRDLQNKKMQVDQLVSQLQNMNEDSDDEDMGSQVRKIVCMKEHLSKLKDMLETVKSTEIVPSSSQEMHPTNESDGEFEAAAAPKSDNLIQNDVRTNQLVSRDDLTKARRDGDRGHSSNERRVKEKQVNKKSMNAQEKERLKLQAELQAKKRELEELMCKHKAASSNLNQDVHCEHKSDVGVSNNLDSTPYPWYPQPATNIYHAPNSAEQYSSDEGPDDNNEYSEVNSSGEASNIQMVPPMAPLRFDGRLDDYVKYKPQFGFFPPDQDANTRTPSRTPDNHIHPISNTTGLPKERVRSNSERDSLNKSQTQKQLELIRSVCDSMLEQQSSRNKPSQQRSVRNNLTPSPLYSEPRQFASPNPHSMNALNVVGNPTPDGAWMSPGAAVSGSAAPFPPNDAAGYQNWLATNTLQTQAFMLNTLNQCCQMLWLQQREITALKNNVSMLQERLQLPYDQSNNQMPSAYPPYPPLMTPESREHSQIRTTFNPKVNHHQQHHQHQQVHHQVSQATSLPNLNQPPPHAMPPANIENAFATAPINNLHSARILDGSLNNGGHINNTLLPPAAASHIWNGPALNNQVAPGNRANNYWDNFRSYSRQNLLSTKSNEGLQNHTPMPIDRLNNAAERSFSFPFAAQKRNSAFQDSANSSSAENTPRRRLHFKPTGPLPNVNPMPPDVLNVNDTHPLKSDDSDPSQRSRNEERCDGGASGRQTKSKLFEELRENVYREVASLISANQARPHFLIQLFRDLQLVSSDPLRRQTLQSIQSVVSESITNSNGTMGTIRQPGGPVQTVGIENDVLANYPSYFEVPTAWNHSRSNLACEGDLDTDCPGYLSDVLTFLNLHNDQVLQQNLLDSLREIVVDSTFSSVFVSGGANPKDSIIQKHFTSLVASAFEPYKGKRIQDVRLHILQTMEELLRGEISLIRLMRESISDGNEFTTLLASQEQAASSSSVAQNVTFDLPIEGDTAAVEVPLQVQNGDLAEADQSRLEVEEDEEGAVGGVLNESNASQASQDELDMSKIDLAATAEPDAEFSEQGLDQVPTRLTTYSLSKRNSSRDRSNSSRSDSEQF